MGVRNQLALLVSTFNLASDDMTVYQQKVELVLAAWPKGKLTELVTRLILGCEGSVTPIRTAVRRGKVSPSLD